MDILFLLIPLSLVLVAFIGVMLFWAVNTGQFDFGADQGHGIICDDDLPTTENLHNCIDKA